ncbi:MAG TPA: argininosuccinate synthase domain-containing protein [Streptosporangiaceae bacterium]|nr:argininosuccinate synthase domain-containing protein [Streptosporangiaceae bacterium]
MITDEEVGVCVSGGLSSLAVAAWLAASGVSTRAFIADIGQANRDEISLLARSLEAAGIPAVVVDLRDRMAQMAVDLVRYLARYEGGYWNTTGASRLVLVEGLTVAMREAGCGVLAHGCVGGGNDQLRFERYTAALAPGLRVFAPWPDPELRQRFPDRSAMEEYVQRRGLARDGRSTADYSVDGSLAGFAHEGTALEGLEVPDTAVRPFLTVLPRLAPDQPETVAVGFDRGQPVQIGGQPSGPRALLESANALAGRHGIGLHSVVENRINGTKCRGVYEAPGLDLLGFCVDRVYQVTIGKEARQLLSSLSELIGRSVYEGKYFDTEIRAARAAADVITDSASANVEVDIYKGSVSFRGISHHGSRPLPARQTRFTGGGHIWKVTA